MSEPENTGRNQDGTFKKGVSGNPAGKPKGVRHKLSEDFFQDLADAWAASGVAALKEMIEDRPHEFVKTVAGLQSKELTGEGGEALFSGLDVAIKR